MSWYRNQRRSENVWEDRAKEQRRRDKRTFWEAVEEDVPDADLKAILHRLAEKAGLE